MRTYGIFLLISVTSLQLFAQACDCQGMVNWKSERTIELLDKPDGMTIAEIQNDRGNENFLIFDFIDSSADYFKVAIQYSINGEPKTGWIKKHEDLGLYMSNYQDGTTLNFMEEPSESAKTTTSINKWYNGFYTTVNCKGTWAKVEVTIDSQKHVGWVERKWHCANPYSTCN